MKRVDIIADARTWIDTPFIHQCRVRGHGGDCVAMIEWLALKYNVIDKPYRTNYGVEPMMKEILSALIESGCRRLPNAFDHKPADILFIQYRHEPQHLALSMPNNRILHGYSGAGRYVETVFNSRLEDGLRSAWEFPGIE